METPARKYKDCLITQDIFENRICERYINSLCQALHDVLRDKVGEDEVDGIFLTAQAPGCTSSMICCWAAMAGSRWRSSRFSRTSPACSIVTGTRPPAARKGAISGVM